MGLLDNFERGLERAVNGAFAKTFRSDLAPVEITAALKRELDTKAAVVSRDRILVPNNFEVVLSPGDHAKMVGLGPTLIDDLTRLVQKHAMVQGYQFAGGISITLVENARLSNGMVQIESSNVQGNVTWTPVLDVAGKRYPITKSRTIIGRGSDADITVDDTGTSRKHVEILWDGKNAQAKDLGSTNGSQLNGVKFSKATLEPDSVVQIGRTRIVFKVLAQADAPAAPRRPREDATSRFDINAADSAASSQAPSEAPAPRSNYDADQAAAAREAARESAARQAEARQKAHDAALESARLASEAEANQARDDADRAEAAETARGSAAAREEQARVDQAREAEARAAREERDARDAAEAEARTAAEAEARAIREAEAADREAARAVAAEARRAATPLGQHTAVPRPPRPRADPGGFWRDE